MEIGKEIGETGMEFQSAQFVLVLRLASLQFAFFEDNRVIDEFRHGFR